MSSIHIIKGNFKEKMELPIAEGLKAGFPSPAEDYNHETLDFNRDLIRNPEATFYGKVEGDSMIEAGINDGDIAVIDRSIEAQDGDIVVGYINDEFTIKYLDLRQSLDISMMSSPSSTSTCVTVRTAISSYVLPTRTSSLSVSMQMMTLKCGAW